MKKSGGGFEVAKLEARLKEIDGLTAKEGFYNDISFSTSVLKEKSAIENRLKPFYKVYGEFKYIKDLYGLSLEANEEKIDYFLHHSLMLVTSLSPVIGYDKAAQIAHKALHDNTSLREACLALGYLSAEDFDAAVKPETMLGPKSN